jgi:hypothetical protein
LKALYERMSEEQTVRLCQRLKGGASLRSAAQSIGIPWSTFARNLKLGRLEHAKMLEGNRRAKRKHGEWAQRIDRAYHEGEIGLLATVRKGEKGWQSCAWILERTRAKYRLTERPEEFDLTDVPGTHEAIALAALRDRNWSAALQALAAMRATSDAPAGNLADVIAQAPAEVKRHLLRVLEQDLTP